MSSTGKRINLNLNLTSLSFSPRFMELLAKRGLVHPEQIEIFLNQDLKNLENPFLMKGMKEAAGLIEETIRQNGKILIHGDYDVDGITGAAVVSRTLAALGADFITFLPDRSRDGYGVSETAIREGRRKEVTLFITVDCGITARGKIELARELGMKVIVIDHHRIPAEGVPPADVILNPLQEDCPYPFKELSAAGLAFKLSQALIGDKAHELLDLAALSTVADVAPLKGENRIIVKFGLKILSACKKAGVLALVQSAKLRTKSLNAGHIGFMLAPRLNAAGRMSSAETALRLLLTDHAGEAESLAGILEAENKLRQKEQQQLVKEAVGEVEKTINFNRERVIVVAREGWHQGVIGIVASKLVDKYHRPSVVIALENGVGKGSGRSIKNFHLFNALDSCKDLFEAFGGHEQAAGLTIGAKHLPELRKRINEYAAENFPADIFVRKIPVDMEIALDDLRNPFTQELALLEPHGAGNPRPVFSSKNVKVKGKPRWINSGSVQIWVTDGFRIFEALVNDREGEGLAWLRDGACFDFSYSVKTKFWDGVESIVLEIKEIKPQL
ncbi:MAG: single-stranded-DNA-specific exonuclease RecJ [Candidatus Omnitrophica bacterium]|nr:single-stranded-DNA-specific exonuclease RecJ [Candidatus Omnitrophota bacterium]